MFSYLTKITGEENIFYDSEERLYRYRMHCPNCGKESGCKCFEEIDEVYEFMDEGFDYTCSYRCFIDCFGDFELEESMKDMGLIDINYKSVVPVFIQKIIRTVRYFFNTWRLKWYIYKYTRYMSEDDAREVIEFMDLDYDGTGGISC